MEEIAQCRESESEMKSSSYYRRKQPKPLPPRGPYSHVIDRYDHYVVDSRGEVVAAASERTCSLMAELLNLARSPMVEPL